MTLTTFPYDSLLDMAPYRGQRQATFRFLLYDTTTNVIVRELRPLKNSTPVLSHDTSRVIMRQVSNIFFDKEDTAVLNTIQHRVKIQMLFPGREAYDLGTYLFVDQARVKSTAGLESAASLVDLMFVVDQQITASYSAGLFNDDGSLVSLRPVDQAIADVMLGVPVAFTTQASPFSTIGSWSAGTNRGSIINDIAVDGDYFAPWLDNVNIMRFIRSFDPSARVPDFDYDNNRVIDRNSLVFVDDLLNAPNRFVVISNGSVSTNNSIPIVGTYDIPSSAPHSIQNRGFVIPQVEDRQIDNTAQATAVAYNLGQRQTTFEQVEFSTIPDPRHDSYNVFRLNNANWLEISWSLPLMEGSAMTHTGRKAYS